MPVKHFVTFETKDSFPKGRDQLKLLWNDVYWTEGERFKMEGGGWNYIDDGYGCPQNSLIDVGLFEFGEPVEDSQGVVKAKLKAGTPLELPNQDCALERFLDHYNMEYGPPPHFFKKDRMKLPTISQTMIDVGGEIIDGKKVSMDRDVVAMWILDTVPKSYIARSWSSPFVRQYILEIDKLTKKPQVWCYDPGHKGEGWSGSSPEDGFSGSMGNDALNLVFPYKDSSYWDDFSEEDKKWSERVYYSWKKVDHLSECEVIGNDITHKSWKQAYIEKSSYEDIGDLFAEKLYNNLSEENSGDDKMLEIEFKLAKHTENTENKINFLHSCLSSKNKRIEELEDRVRRLSDENRIYNKLQQFETTIHPQLNAVKMNQRTLNQRMNNFEVRERENEILKNLEKKNVFDNFTIGCVSPTVYAVIAVGFAGVANIAFPQLFK